MGNFTLVIMQLSQYHYQILHGDLVIKRRDDLLKIDYPLHTQLVLTPKSWT